MPEERERGLPTGRRRRLGFFLVLCRVGTVVLVAVRKSGSVSPARELSLAGELSLDKVEPRQDAKLELRETR